MKRNLAVILSLLLVMLSTVSVFATMSGDGVSGMGNSPRDGSIDGSMVNDENGAVDGSGPVNDTGAENSRSWVGVVIAIIIAAVLIAVVVAILPRRR